MFNDFKDLEKEMQKELSDFFKEKLNNTKYFYNNIKNIRKVTNLKFEYINLNEFTKEEQKKIESCFIIVGEEKFNIKIKKKSIKGDYDVSNINILTKDIKLKQYIKEYFLYYILKKIDNEKKDIQKKNFLYLYTKEYNTNLEFINYRKDKYAKASTLAYYQNLEKDEDKLAEDLYINKDYKDKLQIIFNLQKNDDILYYFNKILSNIKSTSGDKNKKFFYRGQNNSSWIPSASIVREEGYLRNEHLMFYKIISKMPKPFEKDKYIYNKIATMQHFGYPTRLIDITENPLVALYFACKGNDDYDGEIFIYEISEEEILNFEDEKLRCLEKIVTKSLTNLCEDCYKKAECKKDTIKKSYIVQGVAQNERINNQSGNFIFVGIDKEKKYAENTIQKPIKHIIVDKELKKGIIQVLETLNINGGTVYPDLLNLAKFLKEKYKN